MWYFVRLFHNQELDGPSKRGGGVVEDGFGLLDICDSMFWFTSVVVLSEILLLSSAFVNLCY